jgi:glycosyltransferase involved in cell wall biosynthesis
VRAARPDALLLLAGEGPAERHRRALAEPLGVAGSIRWVGYLERERALPDCYQAADAFVFAARWSAEALADRLAGLYERVVDGGLARHEPDSGTRPR